jgi:dihydropyrimidine dehydrogenase (NAD+) subunit PreA
MAGPNLRVTFCGVKLINPFLLASSPVTDKQDMVARGFEAGWAGAVLKTTTHPDEENSIAYPMMAGLEPGNRLVGLHNTDLLSDRFIDEMCSQVVWLKKRFPEQCVALSIMGTTRLQWEELVQKACQAGADFIEASISCPQGSMVEGDETPDGSMISQDARLTEKVTRWAKKAAGNTPIVVKLSPGVTDITRIARAVKAGGGDGICAIDSVESIVGLDPVSCAPLPVVQGLGTRGGYTGRAVKPVGLRCIADIAAAVDLPLSGVGGIYTWQDALEYLLLGATSLQVCTAVMQRGFGIITGLTDGLARWMDKNGYPNLATFTGLGLKQLVVHEAVPHGIQVIASIDEELCIGCGLCLVACRDGAYQAINIFDDRVAKVDQDACVGCGLCQQVCPVPGCIQMVNA